VPTTVDASRFEVGRNLAAIAGAVIFRDEVCEVIQYMPSMPDVHARPVLMVPPQINKYYFMDLARGRSFVEYQVAQGLAFFVVSWCNPGPDQRDWGPRRPRGRRRADDRRGANVSHSDDVNVLALCAGGDPHQHRPQSPGRRK
jgi:polyhydroxyalkanoate synthase